MHAGGSKVLGSRIDLLCFELTNMAPPSVRACTDTKTKHFVDCETRTGKTHEATTLSTRRASTKSFPEVLCHGTKLTSLRDILRDGFLKPSEGIAGYGVYGFQVKVDDNGQVSDENMLNAYERTRAGYNGGAAFSCGARLASSSKAPRR